MKEKILIGIIALLIFILITVRLIFKNKFSNFELSVKQYETEQWESFNKEKDKWIAQLSGEGLSELFNQYFDEKKFIIEKDTTFSFLYLSERVKFKVGQSKYFDCLHKKCTIEKQNDTTQKQIVLKEKELEKKFGSTFESWYPKLKHEKLIQYSSNIDNCSDFYNDLSEIIYDENVWKDFEKFMTVYDNDKKTAEKKNKLVELQFLYNVTFTKKSLRSDVINYFNNKLSDRKPYILTTKTENKTFNSPILGLIKYRVTKKSFNQQAFQNVVDDAFKEQWSYNSLSTGSMPYATCFGSDNSCSGWGCSQIKIITGGSGDVLVSIKNSSGRVVRHGYIKGGYSYTFNVAGGSYQVFFYSGKGWNPNKQMPSSSCNSLKGGFVSNESVTKDTYINLYNQIMKYELILQEDGNFQTKPSSKNEAF